VLRVVVLLQDKVGVFVRQEPRRRGQHVPFQDLVVYGTRHIDEDTAQISDPICRHAPPEQNGAAAKLLARHHGQRA